MLCHAHVSILFAFLVVECSIAQADQFLYIAQVKGLELLMLYNPKHCIPLQKKHGGQRGTVF